ncbi:50S ribosomal protein L6 [bacterium]|nr:50S ribosomal protein L6 [bacterium]MBU1984428.1 50S ribosomal protein L6 [bacterium]
MSRVGRSPISIPKEVEVNIADHVVTVKGPRGELSRPIHGEMAVEIQGNTILVRRPSDEKPHRALHGLTRALIANMVKGVTQGFKKELEIVGVGYRVDAKPSGVLFSVGFSHGVFVECPPGIKFEVPKPTTLIVSGNDAELVGHVAGEIRAVRKPEPYKGKGIRYASEVVRTKAGKTAK